MFTSSPDAGMHCQRCPFHAIHPGACTAFRYCCHRGQGGLGGLLCPIALWWCDLDSFLCRKAHVQAHGVRWVSLSNILWGCQCLRGQELWGGKQQGCTRQRVRARHDVCVHLRETPHSNVFLGSVWLEEAWSHDMGALCLKTTCFLCLYSSVTH